MGRGDLTAARGTPALVSSTLRELLSPQPLTIEFARKTRPRLPASTAPKPRFEEAEDEVPPDLRVELRHSDRALSDLRTELWQAQERARRLASEVWRMDGERSRVRAVQAQLQAEVAGLLQAVRLRPVLHGEHSNAATESASEQERELRETVELLSALRRAVGEGGMLLEVSAVQMERHAWAAERERLTARITSLQRAVQAREIKVAAAREAVEAERNATVLRVAARENAAVAAVEWLTRVPEPDDILVTMGAAATRGRAEGDEAAVEWLTRAPEPNDEGAIPQPFHSHSTAEPNDEGDNEGALGVRAGAGAVGCAASGGTIEPALSTRRRLGLPSPPPSPLKVRPLEQRPPPTPPPPPRSARRACGDVGVVAGAAVSRAAAAHAKAPLLPPPLVTLPPPPPPPPPPPSSLISWRRWAVTASSTLPLSSTSQPLPSQQPGTRSRSPGTRSRSDGVPPTPRSPTPEERAVAAARFRYEALVLQANDAAAACSNADRSDDGGASGDGDGGGDGDGRGNGGVGGLSSEVAIAARVLQLRRASGAVRLQTELHAQLSALKSAVAGAESERVQAAAAARREVHRKLEMAH